jgi:hypothetical protein
MIFFLVIIISMNVLSAFIVIQVNNQFFSEVPVLRSETGIRTNHAYYWRSQSSVLKKSNSNVEDFIDENMNFSPRFAVGESNVTHVWVEDPTNQTQGYYLEKGSGLQELNRSRGQTSRHFYNTSSNEYTFQSDYLANKTNIVSNTDWVTSEEYPTRFIIRLTNGSIFFSSNLSQVNSLFEKIDNTTIWAVGVESFKGILGFYMDFSDNDWGHSQYVFWPRLKSGQITGYNFPLFGIYPHLYAKLSGVWYDKILNDRSLYTGVVDPRNTIHVNKTSDTWQLWFNTYGITILSRTWDFEHGFKFNLIDQRFHMITKLRCRDQDFEDLGMGYEITSSPQSDGTEFQPDRFRLSNETESIEVNLSQAWNAGTYLENFYSQIEIVSQNNESFVFMFEDMELAGFTDKYLNLHNQQFPDGSLRLVLRAGMFGYGAYTQGTIIEIDPTYQSYTTDDYDSGVRYRSSDSQKVLITDAMTLGVFSTYTYRCWIVWDTGITGTVRSTSSAELRLSEYDGGLDNFEDGETCQVELITEYTGTSPKESDGEASLYTNYWNPTTYGGITWEPYDEEQTWTMNIETLTDYWGSNKGSNDMIKFHFEGTAPTSEDRITYYDTSSAPNDSVKPRLTFTYELEQTPTVTIQNDGDLIYAGIEETTMQIRYTDGNGYDDLDDAWVDLSNDDFATYDIRLSWNIDTNVLTVTDSSGFLIGTPNDPTEFTGGSASGGSGYYDLTWKFVIDWDTDWDDSDIDLRGDCDDELGADATAVSDTDAGEEFDDELIFKSSSWTLSDSAYSEDGNTDLAGSEPEWFRGGVGVVASGVVSYESVTTVYPPITQVDVELWVNGNDEGATHTDTTLGASGEYSITSFITSSASGLDADYDFEVKFTGWVGDSDTDNIGTHVGNYLCDSKRDNQVPTFSAWVQDADSDSGADSYAPNTGYEDDTTLQGDFSGCSDGSGVGISNYYIKYNGGSYGSADADGLDVQCTITSGSNDIYYKITDTVGNEATGDTTDNIFYGTTDPSNFDLDIGGAAGWPTDYVYTIDSTDITSGTIYGNSGESDSWSITVDADGSADWGSGGAWKVVFKNWASGTTEDDLAPYTKTDYDFTGGDTPGSLATVIVNNCGEIQTLTLTIDDDTADPTTTFSSITEDNPHTYIYNSAPSQTVYFSDLMSSTDQLFTVVVTVGDTGGSGIYGVRMSAWDDDADTYDTGSPYSRQYSTDSSETSGSINLYTYDYVGNYDASAVVITMTEDTTAPSGFNLLLTADTNTGSGITPDTGYYDDDSVDVSVSGGSDGGSGLPTNKYAYQRDSEGYGAYTSSATNTFSSTSDGSHTLYVKMIDNVGNEASPDSVGVVYDGNSPQLSTWNLYDADGWPSGDYAYYDGTLYIKTDAGSQTVNLTITVSDYGNSGYWFLTFDDNSLLEAQENITTAQPHTKNFDYDGDSGGDFTHNLYNHAGNIVTITITTIADNTDPSMTYALFPDSQVLVSNYYSTTPCYTNVSSESDGGSGLPANFIQYKLDSGSFGSWNSTTDKTWIVTDQSNHTLSAKIRDYVGNEVTYTDWVFPDTIVPVLGWLTLNESYAPNWYDQSVSSTAWIHVNWVEAYPYHVNITISGSLTASDDLTPSGSFSDFYSTLTGASDGSYSITITIYDKAGNSDSTLAGSEAPIQLESGMSGSTQEFWFYFYYFRSDGIGLDWKDFNTSYILDEDYRNTTENRLRGMLFSQKFLNQTSNIRIITRDYFGNIVQNTSYSMPSSKDLYITLSVNTFKVVNIYDDIINITIEHSISSTVFNEQIMPYEIFRWDMYASTYNITALVHGTSTYATDDELNSLNDYQVDLSSNDVAIYIDASDPTIVPTWGNVVANASTIEFGDSKILGWNVPEIVDWEIWLNSSLKATGTSSYPQWTWDTSGYSIAVYNFTLQVISQLSAANTSYIQLTVADTVVPTITYDGSTANNSNIEWGSTYSLEWIVSESINYTIYCNGSSQTTGTGTSISWDFDTTDLSHGYWYNITLDVSDESNNASSIVFFYNRDSTAPLITLGYSSKIIYYSTVGERTITWTEYDLHNFNASIYIDGVNVANYTLDTATELISVTIVMELGVSLYKLTVYDSVGNYASDTVEITVTVSQDDGGGTPEPQITPSVAKEVQDLFLYASLGGLILFVTFIGVVVARKTNLINKIKYWVSSYV